jgi:hypothetical protein
VTIDNIATNSQPNRDERLKQSRFYQRRESRSSIGDPHLNPVRMRISCYRNRGSALITVYHGLERIAYNIDNNLPNLISVNKYLFEIERNKHPRFHFAQLGVNRTQFECLLKDIVYALYLTSCLVLKHKGAESANHLASSPVLFMWIASAWLEEYWFQGVSRTEPER